jgi:sporulation protein YlmC with PRC-barrel domain
MAGHVMPRSSLLRSCVLLAALAFIVDARAQSLYGHLYEPGALPLNEIIGMEVVTAEGRGLGRITDLVFDPSTGGIEEVAVGNARYPLSALISGNEPGRVVVEPPLQSSAGATALLPLSAGERLSEKFSRASRDLGSPEQIIVDLKQGRVRPRQ